MSKEITVAELIKRFEMCDPDAVICKWEPNDEIHWDSIETVYTLTNAKYINDAGDVVTGNIVGIY